MKNMYIIVTGILDKETPYDGDTFPEYTLEFKVNQKIGEGYYPFGNLVVVHGRVAYQAMMLSERDYERSNEEEE